MPDHDDVTRRTLLAAERTWLAWWRSGLAAATAAVAVGGVVPELVGGSKVPYIVIGAGYALLALATFGCGYLRERQVSDALERGGYAPLQRGWLLGLTVGATVLAVTTLFVVVVQP